MRRCRRAYSTIRCQGRPHPAVQAVGHRREAEAQEAAREGVAETIINVRV